MESKIDMSALAMKMLEWERKQKEADLLRAEIEWAVMGIKRTQTVGNVRATYSGGRKAYDYQDAAYCHPVSEATIELFTVTPAPKTDWRKICQHVGVEKDDIPFMQSAPSVRVKLLE